MSAAREKPPRPERQHTAGSWPLARATAKRLISSVERFLSVEASSGILLLAACRPSVEDVCETLEDDCNQEFRVDDCIHEGEELEAGAEDRDCEGAFDDYMDCLDDMKCRWPNCQGVRDDLDACLASGG